MQQGNDHQYAIGQQQRMCVIQYQSRFERVWCVPYSCTRSIVNNIIMIATRARWANDRFQKILKFCSLQIDNTDICNIVK